MKLKCYHGNPSLPHPPDHYPRTEYVRSAGK